jgi:hypothetical protein
VSRLAAALLAVLLAGCTAQQLRDSQRGWREAECDKILSTPQRERCLREARGEEQKQP